MKKRIIVFLVLGFLGGGCVAIDHSRDDMKLSQARAAYVQATPGLHTATQQAILDGQPQVGMTREQVGATLGPPDKNITRFITQFGENETWSYLRYPVNPETIYLFSAATQSEICVEYSISFNNGVVDSIGHFPNCVGIRDLR